MTTITPTSAVQRQRVLEALRERPHTTVELQALNVFDPRPRIHELRKAGYEILTDFVKALDHQGNVHRLGRYTLLREPAASTSQPPFTEA